MARIIEVVDPADARLADFVSLRDVQLRKNLEAAEGLFVAEGAKVVQRAIAAGYPVRSFLMTRRWLAGLEPELRAAGDSPCYVVSDALAEAVTGFHVHRGALASLERRALARVDEVVSGASRIVVLEDIVDHTNVGAIFRCAAALGIDAVLLSPRCADPLYRRSLKVAMGAVFSVPWTRLDYWWDAVPRLSEAGFTTVALTPDQSAMPLAELRRRTTGDKIAFVLGSEGPGLTPRWMTSSDVRIRIPLTGQVDSLNVAAAAAIAFYTTQHDTGSSS